MTGIGNIRISTIAKDKLSALKRKTGIKKWNTLCRWAFCLSLSENSVPSEKNIVTDSNVEMSWRTFTGSDNEELFLALLKIRCLQDNISTDKDTLTQQFKLHLHRGIDYLASSGKIRCLSDLVLLTVQGDKHEKQSTNR